MFDVQYSTYGCGLCSLTHHAAHQALPGHQVVVQALNPPVQGVGDTSLVVVQRRVQGLLGPQRTARGVLSNAPRKRREGE